MRRYQLLLLLICLGLATTFNLTTSASAAEFAASSRELFGSIAVTKLIVMPTTEGHSDWVSAISAAQTSIHMTMFHLTDRSVMSALETRASGKIGPPLDVKVIVDGASSTGGYAKAIAELQAAGVQVRTSSPAFSLSHSKDMVVDGQIAIIGAVNLTNTSSINRDFAIITPDAAMIAEIESVFATDWQNALAKTGETPVTTNENLVWSPTTSVNQLTKLINSSRESLVLESENFNDTDVISALNQAAARGVQVRIVLPECSQGNAGLNYKGIAQLSGVDVHMEHDGGTIDQPYMHSKMMVIDGETVYVGSINFSFNSVLKDRELGAIFTDLATAQSLVSEFEKDWSRSEEPDFNASCIGASNAADAPATGANSAF